MDPGDASNFYAYFGSKITKKVQSHNSDFFKILYSLQQKQCTTALNEKTRGFFEVNFFENLHASTYDI